MHLIRTAKITSPTGYFGPRVERIVSVTDKSTNFPLTYLLNSEPVELRHNPRRPDKRRQTNKLSSIRGRATGWIRKTRIVVVVRKFSAVLLLCAASFGCRCFAVVSLIVLNIIDFIKQVRTVHELSPCTRGQWRIQDHVKAANIDSSSSFPSLSPPLPYIPSPFFFSPFLLLSSHI